MECLESPRQSLTPHPGLLRLAVIGLSSRICTIINACLPWHNIRNTLFVTNNTETHLIGSETENNELETKVHLWGWY